MKIDKKMLARVEQEMDKYHGRFERYFGRSEPREQSRKYLHGLLSAQDRRNGWELAETVGDSVPDRTQRLLYRSGWDLNGVLDEHIQFAREHIGTPHGTFKRCEDVKKRKKVQVPEELSFATKPQQALKMLQHTVKDLSFPG